MINTTAPLAFAACAARTTAASAALWLLFSAPACAQESSEPGSSTEPPFSYPATLLSARSTYTVSPATPVLLGNTVVVLEQSRLSDVAAIARAPVHEEGAGKDARRWVCVQAQNNAKPVKLWFIASGQDTVTEVQMRPGAFDQTARCGALTDHFEPVFLSHIASGMNIDAVTSDIGPASLRDAHGWRFWVSRRTYEYFEERFTEYVWVGALADETGTISDVFTTQITR